MRMNNANEMGRLNSSSMSSKSTSGGIGVSGEEPGVVGVTARPALGANRNGVAAAAVAAVFGRPASTSPAVVVGGNMVTLPVLGST